MFERSQLLVFDLDGTLLNCKQFMPRQAVSYLLDLRKAGIETTLATGRIFPAASDYISELMIALPIILYNGAVVAQPDGQILYKRTLKWKCARDALTLAKEMSVDSQLYLETEDTFYYARAFTPPLKKFSKQDRIPAREVGDLVAFLEDVQMDPIKLLIVGGRSELMVLRKRFQSEYPKPTCVHSQDNYLEILPPGVSKGSALSWLCDRTQINPDGVVAFGDNMNDREMLRVAGTGVAMATAPQEMLDDADVIIDNLSEFLGSLASTVSSKEGVS